MVGIDRPIIVKTRIPYKGIQYCAEIGGDNSLKVAVNAPY
jgi:hypothetical protein